MELTSNNYKYNLVDNMLLVNKEGAGAGKQYSIPYKLADQAYPQWESVKDQLQRLPQETADNLYHNTAVGGAAMAADLVSQMVGNSVSDNKGGAYTLPGGRVVPGVEVEGMRQLYDQNANLAKGVAPTKPYNPNVDQVTGLPKDSPLLSRGSVEKDLGYIGNTDRIKPKDAYNNKSWGTLQETIGGSDLSVFFMAEIINPIELADMAYSASVNPEKVKIDKSKLSKELVIVELDSVMSLSYSTIREVFPVRSIGQVNPRGFTRGPRTISGHIAFTIFKSNVLARLRNDLDDGLRRFEERLKSKIGNDILTSDDQKFKKAQDANQAYQKAKEALLKAQSDFKKSSSYRAGASNADIDKATRDLKAAEGKLNNEMDAARQLAGQQNQTLFMNSFIREYLVGPDKSVRLLDSLPPFHLLVMGTNEHGTFSKFTIKGCRFIDENQYQGTAQPNIVNKVTFVAQDLIPMETVWGRNSNSSTSLDINNVPDYISSYSFAEGSKMMQDLYVENKLR